MRRFLAWSLAGTCCALLTVLAFLPASWLGVLLEENTAGRLTLGDAQGTLWRGSGYIGAASGKNDPLTPLFPGRFSWRLSPMLLLGRFDAELDNAAALSLPVRISGNWNQWQVSHADILLPAERLAALGAPLNTVQPSGQMHLSWQALQLIHQDGKIEMTGTIKLAMRDMASRLSPLKPLGSYDLSLDWHGREASVTLSTVNGPMLLSGSGLFSKGRLQFSGTAQGEPERQEQLANLLSLLGQPRSENDKNIIALEFK